MKFVCNNEKCSDVGKIQDIMKVSYKFVNGKLTPMGNECPSCKLSMDEYDDGEKPNLKTIQMGKYGSASPDKKRDILKARSHEHFKKHIKPFKDHQMNSVMKEFKEMSKG